jgi:hypothetical protein
MKKRLLGFLLVACMFYITCGNEPPDEFYEGTPEDDAQIDSILANAYPQLLNTVDGFVDIYVPLTLPDVGFEDADQLFRADSPMIKQHIDSCKYVFVDTNRMYDRWYTKDTACTVYLIDTFMVDSWGHIDLLLIGHYDSLYIGPTGDTNWVLNTIDTIVPTGDSAYGYKAIEGDGRRLIFLEPLRSTTPTIDEETGDTIGYPIIEPLVWQLKRISYGAYYYPTYGTDVPAVNRVIIQHGSDVDTILSSSYDTTYTGHVMNRFKAIDSLLEYTAGDTLTVTIGIDDALQAADAICYASCGATPYRVQLESGTGVLPVTGQGIVNLYFEAVFMDSYYYVSPDKGFFATVWLIPIRVN